MQSITSGQAHKAFVWKNHYSFEQTPERFKSRLSSKFSGLWILIERKSLIHIGSLANIKSREFDVRNLVVFKGNKE